MNKFLEGKQKAVASFFASMILSFLTAFGTALAALPDGGGPGDLDALAWVTIAGAVVISTGLTTGAVYRTDDNRWLDEGMVEDPPEGRHVAGVIDA